MTKRNKTMKVSLNERERAVLVIARALRRWRNIMATDTDMREVVAAACLLSAVGQAPSRWRARDGQES